MFYIKLVYVLPLNYANITFNQMNSINLGIEHRLFTNHNVRSIDINILCQKKAI